MSQYKYALNKRTGAFNLVPSTIIVFKASVVNYAALPLVGNTIGDARITEDTDHWYSWDGSVWNDQGVFIAANWSNINGSPSSAVADIDDAVTKRHPQNTDQYLDFGGANQIGVTEVVKKQIATINYYINPDTGSDLNPGTSGEPFQTIHQPFLPESIPYRPPWERYSTQNTALPRNQNPSSSLPSPKSLLPSSSSPQFYQLGLLCFCLVHRTSGRLTR